MAFGCRERELEASFKYAVLGSVASSLILLGIALLYSQFGTLNMAHLARELSKVAAADSAWRIGMFSLVLFISGFGLKAALVPFHAWLPDAHPSAPAPISAMLSGVLIKAIGVYALARIVFIVFGVTAGHFGDKYFTGIGAVWAAMVSKDLEKAASLAYTCLTCGRCQERCPVKIDVPQMITELRRIIAEGDK